MAWWRWKRYVPVAQRREKARSRAASLAKKGRKLRPIEIEGRAIARTFWGKAWCENLESYSDFANRLPRGRTYVRNGSVVDLKIAAGEVQALVSGSDLYKVRVEIAGLPRSEWTQILNDCSQSIDSLMDLLAGRFSQGVMERLTRQRGGLFPQPKQIRLRCSCPDWAVLCKHVAAVLYGVGARLDHEPELLFVLRQVDHLELVAHAADGANLDAALGSADAGGLAGEDLGELFGIELDAGEPGGATPAATPTAPRARRKRSASSEASANGSAASARSAPARRPAAKKSSPRKPAAKKRPRAKAAATRKTAVKPAKAAAARKTAVKPAKAKTGSRRSGRGHAGSEAKSPRARKTQTD